MLGQTCRKVLVRGGAAFNGHEGIDAAWPGRDRRASFRDRNNERHPTRSNPNPSCTLRKRQVVHKERPPVVRYGFRNPVRSVKAKCYRSQMQPSRRTQTRRNKARCSRRKRARRGGEGKAGAVRGEVTTETGDTSDRPQEGLEAR